MLIIESATSCCDWERPTIDSTSSILSIYLLSSILYCLLIIILRLSVCMTSGNIVLKVLTRVLPHFVLVNCVSPWRYRYCSTKHSILHSLLFGYLNSKNVLLNPRRRKIVFMILWHYGYPKMDQVLHHHWCSPATFCNHPCVKSLMSFVRLRNGEALAIFFRQRFTSEWLWDRNHCWL